MAYFKIIDIIVLGTGLILLALWLGLYFSGKKYEQMFEQLDPGDYPMGDTYFVGYALTLKGGEKDDVHVETSVHGAHSAGHSIQPVQA